MMTIRHIAESGDEKLVPVSSVDYEAATNTLKGVSDGQPVEYGSGWVFVMNESGKTVAIYDFKKIKVKGAAK